METEQTNLKVLALKNWLKLAKVATLRKMEDPWGCTCLPSSEGIIEEFEDSFISIQPLPDSEQYLEKLENKLAKLKRKNSQDKELLRELSKTKKSHLERFVESDSLSSLNDSHGLDDQPVVSSKLHRFIAPERQANTISELYELIKYDQLGKLFEDIEKEKEKEILKEDGRG